ncbi:hypothetical protein EIP91_004408 [Steccherinum ochraceum]|uniref:Alpha/beta hydrolase fold-3 domain-containing protein n=1 Tax=Steccherinum ochraceum TaxID=92696 RepID=A0A4V2MXH9_9APHY|nr:hypothetical protein EIP91_004408 [Steccherinum ochraceum]
MADSPYAHYGVVDPEYAKAFTPRAVKYDDVLAARQFMHEKYMPMSRERQRANLPDASTYTIQNHAIPVDNGTTTIVVRVITPTVSGPFPLLYHIHGGANVLAGFVMGSIDSLGFTMAALSVELGIVVAQVGYRLAPEHKHPTQVNDCLEGLRWVVNNAPSLNIDLSKGFVIAGESAGASLTATITHLILDDPTFRGKQPTGQILGLPTVVDPRAYPEKYKAELRSLDMVENAHMAVLDKQFICDVYAKHIQNSPDDPTASPLLFKSHANLPPALLQVSGLDLIRDEGIIYDKVLREAGVQSELIVYPGIGHGTHFTYPELTLSKKFHADFKNGLRAFMPGLKK